MAATQTKDKAAQVKLAQSLLAGKARAARFTIAKDAPRADGTSSTFGEGCYVTRGVPVNGGTSPVEHIVLVNGDRQSGMPLTVIAAAIAYGVIPRESVLALLALSE
jgi:hypothetical protein